MKYHYPDLRVVRLLLEFSLTSRAKPLIDLSFNLSNVNNGQAGQATRPVMIHLTVTLPVNAASLSLPTNPPSSVVAVPESTQRYPSSPTGPTSVGVSRYPPERAARPPVARAQDWDIPAPTWPSPTVVDRPPVAGPSTSPPVDVRVETLPTRHARHHSDEATKTAKTTRKREASTDVHSGPLLIPEFEPTIDDIIQTVSRSVHLSYAESFLLTQVIQVSHLINWSGQLLPVPSHRSVNPNLSLVWRWKVISNQLCIRYQRRGTRLTPQVDDN